MGLEAVMVLVDNSEWTRNGDFKPSRFEGQQDAVNLVCDAKTQQNPESTLGIMTIAGRRPEIHLTQTNDIGRLCATISKLSVDGYADLPRAIKIAQLSLKHRQNKNQKQRIVVFLGSPLEGLEEKEIVRLGKQLRKNDVSIDVVNFGHPENIPLLTALVENCNKGGNSHLIEVNYGSNVADTIIVSPIVAYDSGDAGMPADGAGDGAAAGGQPGSSTGGGQFAEYGGIDPNLDPELAMAIRISLEEAKYGDNKQESENKPQEGAPDAGQTSANKPADAEMKDDNAAPAEDDQQDMDEDIDEDDEELKAAIALSMQEDKEKEEQKAKEAESAEQSKDEGDLGGVIDEAFLGEIMQDLGVDMTEDAVKNLLGDEKNDDKDKDKKDDKKD